MITVMKKGMRFLTLATFILWKIIITGGRCRLAWRVLTQAEENHRREPHKILVKCFKNFVYPWLARRKKRQIPNGISKYSIH